MNYTNLKESPVYYKDTVKLIENSFDYDHENHFDIDFYPLLKEENWRNCHIITMDDKVVAHIGVLFKVLELNTKEYPVCLYGGIAVAQNMRGQGLFKNLFKKILEKNSSLATFHLLWSDQLEIYKRFNFYPGIEQFQLNQDLSDATDYQPANYKDLNQKEKNEISSLYNNRSYLYLKRTLKDWSDIEHMTSANLYIKKENDKIINYFFMNKGQDLTQIIYEVGDYSDYKNIRNFGMLWSPVSLNKELEDNLFAAVIKLGDEKKFTDFINEYTHGHISIKKITHNCIHFSFEDKALELDHQSFITGVLGPNRFEELMDLHPIFISGLDSI